MELRTTWTDERLDDLSERVTRMDTRLSAKIEKLDTKLDDRFDQINARLDGIQRTMIVTLVTLVGIFAAGQL